PDFVNELQKHFTGDIRLDVATRALYSTDASIYQIEPLGVAFPKHQEDLHCAVELAARYKLPIVPRGSGSSLAGQAIGEALILDCSRWLDSIIKIDPEARTATVEPGVVLSALNAAAAKLGLTFGPDPASAERATMGGVIANNATGAHSILYGMSADHLISADVVMADGSLATWGEINDQLSVNGDQSAVLAAAYEIREKYAEAIRLYFPRSWRNSAGYRLNYLLPFSATKPSRWEGDYPNLQPFDGTQDRPSTLNLAPLLAGSEGTLAVIRRLKVNLVSKPKHTILGVLAYDSIAEACDDVPRLLEFKPSAIELIPRMIIRLARTVPDYARQMGWILGDPAAVLVVELSGDRPQVLKEAVRGLGDLLVIAETNEEQARIWNVRKVGLGIMDSRPQAARPVAFIEDCAVPVEHLGAFVREVEEILSAHGTEGGIYAHASAGCLHIRPILDLRSGEGVRSLRSIAEQVLDLTLRIGGSMSSEHGDGIVRGEWLTRTYGLEVTEAMRLLKQAADPDNLLNPGKMFDAPPMDRALRYGEDFRVKPWQPAFDFSRQGGLVTAIEQCNGQGVCRKEAGVMCPSFQATREEMHSTRGRANLLRALIRNPLLTNPTLVTRHEELEESVAEALDLCLACKGCKSECPSGVDMSKLKSAFEAEYYKTRRRPLRDYLFGYFHQVAALLAPLAPLANIVMQNSLAKSIAARIFEITPKRPFPKFTSKRAKANALFADSKVSRLLNAESQETFDAMQGVLYLSDPFARNLDPQVEQAAFDILNALGYEVIVLPVVSAGAGLLSKGFVKEARGHAERLLNALNKIDPDATLSIVGLEPPEIYCLKNDYLDLLPDRADEISKRVEHTWLVDEFVIRTKSFAALRIATSEGDVTNLQSPIVNYELPLTKIYFHPHCHHRAEGPAADGLPSGVDATVEMLRACGYEVELIDSGCCGMAGTFGYEDEHFEISQQIGELKLFPYIRQLSESTELTSTHDASKNRQSEIASPSALAVVNRKSAIASSGAACRLQIEQGTGMTAEHPLVLAARALRSQIADAS
ncbi:MAG: FAD-linked oxidase C-terminal domain-containing protein, partial [Chloroflexota bacterium]